MAAFSAVWSRKFRNLGHLNSAYITLLPKKEDAANVKDFRPISLVHSFAKLVTKLLANRLAGWLHQMLSPNQVLLSKEDSPNIISCLCNKQQDFCINITTSAPQNSSQAGYHKGLRFCFLGLPPWSVEEIVIWTNLVRHLEWALGHLIDTSP